MKDLDFDELDKAVNSLMTSVPKTEPTTNALDDHENTLDITPDFDKESTAGIAKIDTVAADATSKAEPAQEQKEEVAAVAAASLSPTVSMPAPAARRGGRFMDVVHPSSDMKKAGVLPRPASRQGVTIDPVAVSKPESTVVEKQPVEDAGETVPTETIAQEVTATENWPDPIEMNDFKEDTVPTEDEWSSSSDTAVAVAATEPAPLTSPFLPDTKVEKRPLGSAASSPVETTEDIDPAEASKEHEDKTIDDPNDQLPAMPGDIPQQLPEELQSDLMSIEADTHEGMPKAEQSHPSDEKLLESGLPAEPDTTPTPVPSNGPVSIPQQYKEEPSTGDQKTAGIYDTDTFHSPLEHPAAKKNGWMLVVWIVAILLTGAGIGAALFFWVM